MDSDCLPAGQATFYRRVSFRFQSGLLQNKSDEAGGLSVTARILPPPVRA